MSEIFQLKITLDGTKPPIWRQVLVDRKSTFFDLHNVIQLAMGWEDEHLFEFKFKNLCIGEQNDELGIFSFGSDDFLEASETILEEIITATKQKFLYHYDFGDDWEHTIVVEKILPRDVSLTYPICTDGQLNCPPEDCGGVPGFYYMMDILKDKEHPEREEMLEWVGEDYDMEYFDKEKVNLRFNKFWKKKIKRKNKKGE